VSEPKVWTIDDFEVRGRREITLRDEHYDVTIDLDGDEEVCVEHEVDSENYGGGSRTVRCYVPVAEFERWLKMVRPSSSTAPRADADAAEKARDEADEKFHRFTEAVQRLLTAWASGKTPKCRTCERPAVCVGYGEEWENLDFACDECCGHGNEDGWCTPIVTAPAPAPPPQGEARVSGAPAGDPLLVASVVHGERVNAEAYAPSPRQTSEPGRPPGPPSSPDRCRCGAVTLWRNPAPDASATDPLTGIRHTRAACARPSDAEIAREIHDACAPLVTPARQPSDTSDIYVIDPACCSECGERQPSDTDTARTDWLPVALPGHPSGCNAGSPGGMCCSWCPPDALPSSPSTTPETT
jgi:hypothetical protein